MPLFGHWVLRREGSRGREPPYECTVVPAPHRGPELGSKLPEAGDAAGLILSDAGPRTPLGGHAGARLSPSNPEAGECEFEAGLVYTVSSGPTRVMSRDSGHSSRIQKPVPCCRRARGRARARHGHSPLNRHRAGTTAQQTQAGPRRAGFGRVGRWGALPAQQRPLLVWAGPRVLCPRPFPAAL